MEAFNGDQRVRYAAGHGIKVILNTEGTTKLTPDELEDRPMTAKGMGKGDYY